MGPVTQPLRRLTQDEVNFFYDNGYLHVKSIASDEILNRARAPIERWVDRVITKWYKKGLIPETFSDLPFDQRYSAAWGAAKSAPANESLRQEIASNEVIDLLRYPPFIDVACDLMHSSNILSILALCRPKLPNRLYDWNSPWHQDAQYRNYPFVSAEFIVMWIPLMDVNEENSCLQFAIGDHKKNIVYKSHLDEGGMIPRTDIILPEDYATFSTVRSVPVKRGDIVCIHRLMPHRALPNKTDRIRWSMDIRFSNLDDLDRLHITPPFGFVSAHTHAARIQWSYEECYNALWPA